MYEVKQKTLEIGYHKVMAELEMMRNSPNKSVYIQHIDRSDQCLNDVILMLKALVEVEDSEERIGIWVSQIEQNPEGDSLFAL